MEASPIPTDELRFLCVVLIVSALHTTSLARTLQAHPPIGLTWCFAPGQQPQLEKMAPWHGRGDWGYNISEESYSSGPCHYQLGVQAVTESAQRQTPT